jgi:penicillin-binding protein 2
MNFDFTTRYSRTLMFLLALSILLGGRLFLLTVIQGNSWDETSDGISTRDIPITAPRGEIYDRYGNLIAGNRQIFTVKMSAGTMEPEELNNAIGQLIGILDQTGDTLEDNFPIVSNNGSYSFTYDSEIQTWLAEKNLPTNYTAEEAFDALRLSLGIDPALTRYEAQLIMQNTYNEYPPISVISMKYNSQLARDKFLKLYKLDENISAKDAFLAIRSKMKISSALSDEQARRIMAVSNEMKLMGYRKYLPAVVAKDVSDNTVMIIEEMSESLPGVSVESETRRYYPNGSTASHILGYMGKISDDKKEEYIEKGYEANAIIGLTGIEGTFESMLHGTNGYYKVQVNAMGERVKLISQSEPVKGKDIYLTIDLNLQKTAEAALKQGLEAIRTGGTFISKFGDVAVNKAAPNAEVGAVVAIEVETGEVLAMASYPDYDPSLFADGISNVDWSALQTQNPRDPLAPAPLYNVATRSAVQPGSTFKMVTATAGLEAGLDPYKKLRDGGHIMLGTKSFGCVLWNLYRRDHGYLDMARALEVSCNYYFYDVATGKDWYTGKSLGYKKPITIDDITAYANQYGLGLSTGIEIPETVLPVPSKARKLAGLQTSLRNVLYASSEIYFEKRVVGNPDLLEETIEKIVGWLGEDISRTEMITKRLVNLGVKEKQIEPLADLCLYTYFNQTSWSTADAMNIAIGQGENAYTPLQMANYIATLGNNGVRNQVSLIKSIENQGEYAKADPVKVEVSDDKYFDQIIDGMRLAATGSEGSLSRYFANFPVKVAAKTGTAERAGTINPPSEVAYIKAHLSAFNSALTWAQVDTEMKRLMQTYPTIYVSEDVAVRRAVINLSDGKLTSTDLNRYKSEYDNFAWVLALAPADNPKIAVAVMIVQGATGPNAGAIAREVIGEYLQVSEDFTIIDLNSKLQ